MKIFLPVLLFILSFQSFGQEIASKIDREELKFFVKTLTSASFEGRGVDTQGHKKAQEFIADRFAVLQLEPFSGDGYLEKFSLSQSYWNDIYIKTQNGKTLWNFDKMLLQNRNTQNEETEKEVVFGGFGTQEELDRIDVENRYVLVFLLKLKDKFGIEERLSRRNAAGLIVFHTDDRRFESMKRTLKEHCNAKKYTISEYRDTLALAPQPKALLDSLSNIIIPGTELKNIMGLPKNKLIKLAKKGKADAVPAVAIKVKFERIENEIETANVVGIVRGETDTVIIVSAHYDHLGKEGNLFYPGADDNASGVAALLELAEEFSLCENLKYTMLFLATSAEESGLLGSYYHVSQSGFDPQKVICNLNIDMISRCDGKHTDCRYLYCISDNQPEALDSLVREADRLYHACSFDYSGNGSGFGSLSSRSDSHNFVKRGVPSILFFGGMHNDYHKPDDTMDKIDFKILESRVQQIGIVIKLLQEKGFSR
ncbi:MAG: M20/M25/M40 family metallo-hydrolase [Prolixibacteraceae bacterium]|nr:M20/M25/M40 family metallo-hydrolase [Prolixibacteraceae bacterium]